MGVAVDIEFSSTAQGPVILPVLAGQIPDDLAARARLAGFEGEAEATLQLEPLLLLAGLGAAPGWREAEIACAMGVAAFLEKPVVTLDLRALAPELACAGLLAAALRAWRFDALQTRAEPNAAKLARICVQAGAESEALWPRFAAVLAGVTLARNLVAEPANRLNPGSFAGFLAPLADAGVKLQVITGDALRAAGLTGLAAVGGASVTPPALLVLEWAGAHAAPPVAFVGKGITFDTGGICIKPAEPMWDMRADMAGAAACAGAMLTLALRKSPAPVVAFLAVAENTTGGGAYRPSDILRHANGTTIEVVDTDAEGRLVLADALHQAVLRKPQAILDLATLTGAIVVALGHHTAGLFANDDALAGAAAAAGAAVGEAVWRMPIAASHRETLNSDIADLRHCSPERMQPDASHAAAFLREFVGEVPWAHLDIAGVETLEEATPARAKGPTGFGVRLLDRLIADRFEGPHRV